MKAVTFQDMDTAKLISDITDSIWQKSLGSNIKGFNHLIWLDLREEVIARGNEYKFR
jgi:predicted NAD-dependent protein-ADP-ribosyltransferase YbiA (DUF1768 family)